MIQGYFSEVGVATRRPFVDAVFEFADWSGATLRIPLLVDTGADCTIIAPLDALKLDMESALRLDTLLEGMPTVGVGGKAKTRLIDANLILGDGKVIDHWQKLTIIEPPASGPLPTYPSLLGRDILVGFGLVMHQRKGRVLLLEHEEMEALRLTSVLPVGESSTLKHRV